MGKAKRPDQVNDGQPVGIKKVIIKKYANRRLYNTATSKYVTLDDLSHMVREGSTEFVVRDAKTGDDITRSVLTQIIVEEEAKGHHLLPISFLRRLICLYGDNLQFLVPRYLDVAMENFSGNQERMRQYLQDTLGGFFPFDTVGEVSKHNMALLRQAADMFTPFGFHADQTSPQKQKSDMHQDSPENSDQPDHQAENAHADPAGDTARKLDDLERRMNALRAELGVLNKK